MESNYRTLGDYIEKLNRKNEKLEFGINDVCGITNTKKIMKGTRANLNGRTFEKFTILYPKEFIFNRRTSRNGEKISIGYNSSNNKYILTEDYCHFKIKQDKINELDPDYLYLSFLNPEFDRYVRYNSWGSATEFFNWEDMCDVKINIPNMLEQNKIVRQHNVIEERINVLSMANRSLLNLVKLKFQYLIENKVCNSSIGNLIIENPKSKIQVGEANTNGKYLFFTSGDTILKDSNKLVDGCNLFLNTGGRFDVKLYYGPSSYSTDTWCITGIDGYSYYLYLQILNNFDFIASDRCFRGSALKHLKKDDMKEIAIYEPNEEEILDFSKYSEPVFKLISSNEKEITLLRQLQETIRLSLF